MITGTGRRRASSSWTTPGRPSTGWQTRDDFNRIERKNNGKS
jgi:hypothetical protein